MTSEILPRISVSLSLHPNKHSFSRSAEAPLLTLTVTSHHSTPLTIYADDLSPKLMLTCGVFVINDVTMDNTKIRQSIQTHCRIPPPSKIVLKLNRDLFHTLLPNTPVILSTPFTRNRRSDDENNDNKNINNKPLAKHDPRYLSSSPTAKHGACGVDGLEPGHKYTLSVVANNNANSRLPWTVVRWWEYGTKEEVLREDGSKGEIGGQDGEGDEVGKGGKVKARAGAMAGTEAGLDPRKVMFGRGPHEPVVIDSAGLGVIEFECLE